MILQFTLTMPGRNSWNGRWSGDGELFARFRHLSNTKVDKEKAANVPRVECGHSRLVAGDSLTTL